MSLGGLPSLGNMVNVPTGFPATEKYPGAVSPGQYSDADTGESYPVEGPVQGDSGFSPFGTATPPAGSGGGIVDLSYTYGTDAPAAAWDSSGGIPTVPNLSYPGAVPPELHGDDGTGAVAAAQAVVPAAIGQLTRRTVRGQTWNRDYVFESANGMYVPSVNGRTDLDQSQAHDPHPGSGGGYAPWDTGYAERPVFLNVAYQATPVSPVASQYGVSGALPDRAPFNDYPAQSYETPADPTVSQPSAPAASGSSGWLLG